MKTPFVFDIKRSSTVDGPGIRTAIFLKGCNLDCFWCHNPEGKNPERERAFFEEKCTKCNACEKTCENDVNTCTVCGKCAETCPSGAIKIYGRKYTENEIFEIIKRDAEYFDVTCGGVTFSGGECMLYPEFVGKIAEKCHACGISVAIDTAGHVPFSAFEKIMPYVDLFLYDLKCIDSTLHRKGVGVGNEKILENLDLLLEAGKRVIIRIPVVPGFNDGDELLSIKKYCEEKNLEYELLPYHTFGEEKKKALDNFLKKEYN